MTTPYIGLTRDLIIAVALEDWANNHPNHDYHTWALKFSTALKNDTWLIQTTQDPDNAP